MSKHIATLFPLLLFALSAWSQALDKESSFTVEQDVATGMWRLECELKLDGIDPSATYSIGAAIQHGITGSTTVMLVQNHFDILGSERSKTGSEPWPFAFEAKKMGQKLSVGIDVAFPVAWTDEGFNCVIHISDADGPIAHLSLNQGLNSD